MSAYDVCDRIDAIEHGITVNLRLIITGTENITNAVNSVTSLTTSTSIINNLHNAIMVSQRINDANAAIANAIDELSDIDADDTSGLCLPYDELYGDVLRLTNDLVRHANDSIRFMLSIHHYLESDNGRITLNTLCTDYTTAA